MAKSEFESQGGMGVKDNHKKHDIICEQPLNDSDFSYRMASLY